MGTYAGCNPDVIGSEKDARIAVLEAALREVVLRTSPYQSDDEWPLACGLHRVASEALSK